MRGAAKSVSCSTINKTIPHTPSRTQTQSTRGTAAVCTTYAVCESRMCGENSLASREKHKNVLARLLGKCFIKIHVLERYKARCRIGYVTEICTCVYKVRRKKK